MEPTQQHAAAVIEVDRPLVSTRDRNELHGRIAAALQAHAERRLVLDFTRARWFGVPILDELITTQTHLDAIGGELAVVAPVSRIQRMLKAAGVDRVKLFSSVHSALSSFHPPVHVAA